MTTRYSALQMLAAKAMGTDDVKLTRLMQSRCAVALRGQRDEGTEVCRGAGPVRALDPRTMMLKAESRVPKYLQRAN
jgi:hypothetical protein